MQSINKKIIPESLFVGLLFLILFLVTLSKNLSAAHDSISYINEIDKGIFFHPHHLLYNYLAAKWVVLLKVLGIGRPDSVYAVESLNSVFGAMTISLGYIFLRKIVGFNLKDAFILSFLPAASFGFWYYSTTVEVYIIPLFFLFLCFLLFFSCKDSRTKWFLIGLFHGIAILFHQVHCLFFITVVSVIFIQNSKPFNFKRIFSGITVYSFTAAIVSAFPYLFITHFILGKKTFLDKWDWFTDYAQKSEYWNTFGINALIKAAIGFGRSIIGGHFIFPAIGGEILSKTILKGKWIADEMFLVRNMSRQQGIFLIVLTLLLFSLIAYLKIISMKSLKKIISDNWKILTISFIWLVSYTIFFIFWEPSNLEFWIPQSLIAWLILIVILKDTIHKKDINSKIVLLLPVLLFSINLFGSMRFFNNWDNDYYFRKVIPLQSTVSSGDLVITGRSWIIDEYVMRFTKGDVISLESFFKENISSSGICELIENRISEGRKVFVLNEAVEPEKGTLEKDGSGILTYSADLWTHFKGRLKYNGEGFSGFYIISSYPTDKTPVN